jgi:hypothetical protein
MAVECPGGIQGLNASVSLPVSQENQTVYRCIHQKDSGTEQELHILCQTFRIDDRFKIMHDAVTAIGRCSCSCTEIVFQPGKGTDPAGQFYDDAPQGTGQVKPDYPREKKTDETAQKHENDERTMEDQDAVGKEQIDRISVHGRMIELREGTFKQNHLILENTLSMINILIYL